MTAAQTSARTPAQEMAASRRLHWMNMLDLRATDRGDNPALTDEAGKTLTWGELHAEVGAVAADLQRRGVKPGDRVFLLALNRAQFITAMVAVNRVGAITVPLNIRSTAEDLDYLIDDAGATIGFVDDFGAQVLRDATITPKLDVIRFGEEFASIASSGAQPEFVDVPEHETAMIMYTSGTTSAPKGVVLTYMNLLSQAMPILKAAPPSTPVPEATLVVVPLFHIAAVGFLTPAFLEGNRLVVAPPSALANIEGLADLLEKEQITNLFLVPTLWQALCALPGIRERNLPLRSISWGASPATREILQAMHDTFPEALVGAAFGQTEMSPVTCYLKDADSLRKMGSIGKPIGIVAAKVVGPDGEEVAQGETGEIVYRGPGLMTEYWNKPEQTEAATYDGWFHSGDLVRADEEGYLYVVDRAKDLIISGGENISSVEVEHAVAAHPKVADACVIGVDDPQWIETPMAVVVPADPADPPTLEEIQEFLADGRLASFKKPTKLEVVEELPRNASGKLQKHILRAEYKE